MDQVGRARVNLVKRVQLLLLLLQQQLPVSCIYSLPGDCPARRLTVLKRFNVVVSCEFGGERENTGRIESGSRARDRRHQFPAIRIQIDDGRAGVKMYIHAGWPAVVVCF